MTGWNGIGSGHFETGSGGHFRGTMQDLSQIDSAPHTWLSRRPHPESFPQPESAFLFPG